MSDFNPEDFMSCNALPIGMVKDFVGSRKGSLAFRKLSYHMIYSFYSLVNCAVGSALMPSPKKSNDIQYKLVIDPHTKKLYHSKAVISLRKEVD